MRQISQSEFLLEVIFMIFNKRTNPSFSLITSKKNNSLFLINA